jgi:hypothetical protein
MNYGIANKPKEGDWFYYVAGLTFSTDATRLPGVICSLEVGTDGTWMATARRRDFIGGDIIGQEVYYTCSPLPYSTETVHGTLGIVKEVHGEYARIQVEKELVEQEFFKNAGFWFPSELIEN